MLRNVIRPHIRHGNEASHRSGVHEVAFILCQESGGKAANAVDDSPDVRTESEFPVLETEFPDGSGSATYTRVVADDMCGAKRIESRLGQIINGLCVAHVCDASEDFGPCLSDLFGSVVERAFFYVGEDDLHTSCGEAVRECAPDSARATGYNRHLVFEILHELFLYRERRTSLKTALLVGVRFEARQASDTFESEAD